MGKVTRLQSQRDILVTCTRPSSLLGSARHAYYCKRLLLLLVLSPHSPTPANVKPYKATINLATSGRIDPIHLSRSGTENSTKPNLRNLTLLISPGQAFSCIILFLQHHAAACIETEGYVPSRKQPGCTLQASLSPRSRSNPLSLARWTCVMQATQTPPPHSPCL